MAVVADTEVPRASQGTRNVKWTGQRLGPTGGYNSSQRQFLLRSSFLLPSWNVAQWSHITDTFKWNWNSEFLGEISQVSKLSINLSLFNKHLRWAKQVWEPFCNLWPRALGDQMEVLTRHLWKKLYRKHAIDMSKNSPQASVKQLWSTYWVPGIGI